MLEGTVKFFNATKGYGFIKPDRDINVSLASNSPADVFVHIRELKACGLERLIDGQRVRYDAVTADGKGPKVVKIEVL